MNGPRIYRVVYDTRHDRWIVQGDDERSSTLWSDIQIFPSQGAATAYIEDVRERQQSMLS